MGTDGAKQLPSRLLGERERGCDARSYGQRGAWIADGAATGMREEEAALFERRGYFLGSPN